MTGAKPNQELTTAEIETLRVYTQYLKEHGEPPLVRELAKRLGIYPNAAQHRLNRLREKGALAPRKITVTRLVATPMGLKKI